MDDPTLGIGVETVLGDFRRKFSRLDSLLVE
jgi:hypothetical protein